MYILQKDNLLDYLRVHYTDFVATPPITVATIGEDETEAVGLINHIFRVTAAGHSVIVKQGRAEIRSNEAVLLPPDRNRMEYESLRLRRAIIPEFIPETYYADWENNIFVMEDVSYLKSARPALTQGVMYRDFGTRCGAFIAANSFYTSEFYLDTQTFRALSCHFTNSSMRRVMEDWLFLRKNPFPQMPGTRYLKDIIDGDGEITAQCYLLRHQYMTKSEALIHSDLHTSNLFIDDNHLKVLDMEYTFAGPFCYDVGYFLGSLITQYCAACYRPYATQRERESFKDYILQTMAQTYNSFCENFCAHWQADAKEDYRHQTAFREKIMAGFLADVLGYAAVPGISQALSNIGLISEFQAITNEDDRRSAMELCAIIDRHLLYKRSTYATVESVLSDFKEIEKVQRRHHKT